MTRENIAFTYHLSLVTVFMFPEIDRRCENCGAAVRRQAKFCPYCGENMSDERVKATDDDVTNDVTGDENMSSDVASVDGEAASVEDAHAAQVETSSETSHVVALLPAASTPVTRTAPAFVEETQTHETYDADENVSHDAHAVESQIESDENGTVEAVSSDVTHAEVSGEESAASSATAIHDESSVSTFQDESSTPIIHDDDSIHVNETSHEVPPTREVALISEPPPTREISVPEQEPEAMRPRAYSPAIFSSYDKRPTRLDKFQRAASDAIAEGKQRAVARFGENETMDDAGARFVIIAAALFVVALVLFIFSTILK